MDEIKSLGETLGVKSNKFSLERVMEYQQALVGNEQALDYLKVERGFTEDTIKHFRLGYHAERNAIVIPLFKRGEVVGIKFRLLDKDDTMRYDNVKGGQNWIYNEDGIEYGRKKGFIIIVEGEFDCISAWQAGIRNVVSPASGKDSYGVWIEQLDTIPKILIAYDNDDGGKGTSVKMAERLGNDKCFEVVYPDGVKDANDYFKRYTIDDFKGIVKASKPFYKYDFKGMADVINSLRTNRDEPMVLRSVPNVKFEKDWIVMLSGVSNAGKTSFALNIASEFAEKGIPTLVLPFERGIEQVGRRYLQVQFNKTLDEFSYMDNGDWDKLIRDCIELPVYFALPKKNDITTTIIKSKRLFDTRVVIVDHLDYLIRGGSQNRNDEIANTLQALKRVAEENKILLIIVSHIKKVESGGMLKRKPSMEDLKGSSSLYQDPEVVIMINRPADDVIEVDILKNKGEMAGGQFKFNNATGKLGERLDSLDLVTIDSKQIIERANSGAREIYRQG
jgi:Mrp family chromosome partitioning ATPase